MNIKTFIASKNFIKGILKILITLFLFIGITNTLNYIYVTDDDWTRILWHNFYENKGKIDNVYIGSSHVHCDINPVILDEKTGQYNFNLTSGNQNLVGSYYLLKEADRLNSLSHVYLELFYMCSTKDNFNSYSDPIETSAHNNWINTDYMENTFNKFEYILNISKPDKYIEVLIPFSRYRAKLDDWVYIKQTLDNKESDSYMAYKFHKDWNDGNGYDEYREQGYFYSTREFKNEQRIYQQSRILEQDPLGKTSEKYLRKIINYCLGQNIPITLFISPIDNLALISTEGYDNYINQIRNIALEYGISFYDFNLAKDEYLPLYSENCFRDIGHLNTTGADIYTSFFSKIMFEDSLNNEKYFYSSYSEKLQNTPPIYMDYIIEIPFLRTYQSKIEYFG